MVSVDSNTKLSLLAALAEENKRRAEAGLEVIPAGSTSAEINLNGESATVTLI